METNHNRARRNEYQKKKKKKENEEDSNCGQINCRISSESAGKKCQRNGTGDQEREHSHLSRSVNRFNKSGVGHTEDAARLEQLPPLVEGRPSVNKARARHEPTNHSVQTHTLLWQPAPNVRNCDTTRRSQCHDRKGIHHYASFVAQAEPTLAACLGRPPEEQPHLRRSGPGWRLHAAASSSSSAHPVQVLFHQEAQCL